MIKDKSYCVSARIGEFGPWSKDGNIFGYGADKKVSVPYFGTVCARGEDYYVHGVFDGHDDNMLGLHGSSDYWKWSEDENGEGERVVESTETPSVDSTIFIDGWYTIDNGSNGIIVITGQLADHLNRYCLNEKDYTYTLG